MHFLPFSKSHVFMPMRSEDLEPAGIPGCSDRGGRRASKKRWEILCAAPNVQNRSEPLRTDWEPVRCFSHRSATCNHQDWYCITCKTNYSYGGYGHGWAPKIVGFLTIWIMIKWNRRNHTVKLTMAMQGLSYCSHQTGHRVGVHLLLARPSRNLMNKSIDLFLIWYPLSMFADSRVNIMSFNVSPNDMWNVF